jgi:hypothetical protein
MLMGASSFIKLQLPKNIVVGGEEVFMKADQRLLTGSVAVQWE